MTEALNQTITVQGRIRYPHLFQPKRWRNDDPSKEPQFSCEICLDQNDPQLQNILAIEAALIQQDLAGAVPNENNRLIKVDPTNTACAGMIMVKSKSKEKPEVYVRDPDTGEYRPCINPSQVKDGDYVAAEIWVYGYTQSGRGISSKLQQVLWLGQGPGPLGSAGGASNPQDAFAGIVAPAGVVSTPQAPAAPYAPPVAPAAPQPPQVAAPPQAPAVAQQPAVQQQLPPQPGQLPAVPGYPPPQG